MSAILVEGTLGNRQFGVILNLDQWLKRSFIKKNLFGLFVERNGLCN